MDRLKKTDFYESPYVDCMCSSLYKGLFLIYLSNLGALCVPDYRIRQSLGIMLYLVDLTK